MILSYAICFHRNFLNLSILCSKEMRNRANDLLAAVSFSDFSFFVAMLPHSLATHFDQNLLYRKMYLPRKLLLSALVNWMSAAAIWFIFAVTFERYLVVRSPLHARIYWKTEKLLCTLVFIFASTLFLTVYHLWEYDCQIVHFCNYTQVQIFCTAPKNSHTDANEFVRFYYIQASKICSVVFAQRKRITSVVVVISICFATTQGPSAVLSLLEFFTNDPAKLKIVYKLMGIANALYLHTFVLGAWLYVFKDFQRWETPRWQEGASEAV
ncbi:G-PROTEIN-RECEP-F1-2 domain-containing protein [Aphelenchoides bicaudatus]|nr:G-PROTEIN-RECEP-F1-2 domain-containing protein [Aphelenchoides bicaudatus]